MKKNSSPAPAGLSRRLHFPEEERRFPWLPLLLDAYAIADTGVAVAVKNAAKKQGKKLACGKGCGACCVHQTDLPLYPHELVGIYWYASEKITGPSRDILKKRFAVKASDTGCPFLIDNSCSIHPLRPMGCRQFNVFTAPCGPGEDPFFTRRGDVLQPDQDYLNRAFASVVPFYNLGRDVEVSGAIKIIRSQMMNLLSFDWSKLVTLLEKASVSGAVRKDPGKTK